MVYIKRMVATGFKSFARRTEVLFDKDVNVVIGANGSGKSNVADAICFALGRLSIKSMRAAKAKNLLFLGSKYIKPAREAVVELVFDNLERTFPIDKDEVSLTRIVRRNGQSIYKINDETKTRSEIIELLAQAGIDPHGFNIVLQGQIQYIVRMHADERRKIIEDVAGISIYESKKEKSLKELEKTDEKLKEIGAIIRERTIYLKNLEKERSQALRFKELEIMQKRLKASILSRKISDKNEELDKITKSIDEKTKLREKEKEKIEKLRKEIEELQGKINKINKDIQDATGLEQEKLHDDISNLKAELEGIRVRKENYENRKNETEKRVEEIKSSIPSLEKDILELRKESPELAKKAQDLKKKKEELARIEAEKDKLINFKTELYSLRSIIQDKERQINRARINSESYLKTIESNSHNLIYKNESDCANQIISLRQNLAKIEKEIEVIRIEEINNEKSISVSESEINQSLKIKSQVEKIDVCPLCQNKMTPEHLNHVFTTSDDKIKNFTEILKKSKLILDELKEKRTSFYNDIIKIKQQLSLSESEMMKHKTIADKKEQMKNELESEKLLKDEIIKIEEKRKNLELKIVDLPKVEAKYDSILLEIEEISSRTKEDADTALLYKERELETVKNVIKHSTKDLETIKVEIIALSENLSKKTKDLLAKEKQEEELNAKFKKMFETRDEMQKLSQEKSLLLSDIQNTMRQVEDQVNYLRIGKAKFDAERESLEIEIKEFPQDLEIIKATIESLQERLAKTTESLMQIGSINMRALEMYEDMKKEYDAVSEKVSTLEKEKVEIMKVIEEIDKKKYRSFMKTFKSMNELFTQNFSKLYTKGVAYLEIENKENIFEGGINIVVKLAKGKYFDVTSLSGGEQTLVALSLLFAIQEYKPYHFYIFDEIDAALDKRNSERLAALIAQYMEAGQYIVITHNDAIIMESNVLYGVSMQDGVSKVLSLKLTEAKELAKEVSEAEKQKSEEELAKEKKTKEDEEEIDKELEDENIEEEPSKEESDLEKEEELEQEVEETESEKNLEDIEEEEKEEFK